MRGMRERVLLAVALGGVAVAAYHVFLTPEARKALQDMLGAIKRGYEAIDKAYGDAQGKEMKEDVLPNREATIAQWESIGF